MASPPRVTGEASLPDASFSVWIASRPSSSVTTTATACEFLPLDQHQTCGPLSLNAKPTDQTRRRPNTIVTAFQASNMRLQGNRGHRWRSRHQSDRRYAAVGLVDLAGKGKWPGLQADSPSCNGSTIGAGSVERRGLLSAESVDDLGDHQCQ